MSIIGSSLERVDAPEKARGIAKYTGDYSEPGMLKVALARAKTAHGRILGMEIPEIPEGVFCYTAKDLPCNRIPSVKNDQPALAEEKVRYEGEPFAVVAAPSKEEAEAFAEKIRLICEPLPPVDDLEEALSESAPKLFDGGNLCYELHSRKGDTEAAFAACDKIFEETFTMPVQCPGFLENESAFTKIDDRGRLALISATQNAFEDRKVIATVLDIPEDRVTSKAAVVGGAFGGKDGNTTQLFAAIVTYFTRKPAQYIYTKTESIRYGIKRHAARVRIRMGFDKNGLIRAFRGKLLMDTGAYALLGTAVLELATEHMPGPYYVPAIDLDGYLVYTSHTPASAMRGFGGPQTVLAVETLLDRAAEYYGIGKLEIRKRNALHEGQTGPMGPVMEFSFGFDKTLEALEKTDLYQEMISHPEPGCGYGIGAALKSNGMGKGCPDFGTVELERLPDGHYRGHAAVVEIGQGAKTALTMIVAEALGVAPDLIDMRLADSEDCVDSGSTAASRDTYIYGRAFIKAAEELKSGKNYARVTETMTVAKENGIHAMFTSLAEVAKIKIDPVSGAVRVLEVSNVSEAGMVINQAMMDGQIYGGIVMSTGYLLSEQIRSRAGRTMEDSLANYILPTAMDAPEMTSENVPVYEKTGPFGAKGIGEASTIAIIPAVAAAIRDLCPGIDLTELPADREKILRYYRGKECRA